MGTILRRTGAWLVAAALMVVAGLASPVHADHTKAVGWIVSRTGSSAAAIDGTLAATGLSEESAVVMFALKGAKERKQLDYRFDTTTAEWGVDGWAQIDDSHVPSVTCAAACENPVGVSQTVSVSSNGRALISTVYIAASTIKDATLTITSPGWKVRAWVPTWRELSTATAKNSTLVSAAHTSAGTYRGGEIAGGRYGSFASAALPCDLAGVGSATMTGGTRVWPMSCNTGTAVVDGSSRGTTWRVRGQTTGVGWWTAVLIVVDYPR